MGLPAGLLEFLGPVGWGAAALVGVVILIQVVQKNREEKHSISPGTHKCFGDERTRLKEEKSNEASGRTGNSRKKRVEPCRHDEHEHDIIKGYGLGHVHKYKDDKKFRPSWCDKENEGITEADHIPPKDSLKKALNNVRLDRLLQVNPRLHEMIMSLVNDPTGQKLLTMRVLYQDHRDALTTGSSKESKICRWTLTQTILSGKDDCAVKMLEQAFIMGHPIASQMLRHDAGFVDAALRTEGKVHMSDEGTRSYYRYGYTDLVDEYLYKGIINDGQAKDLKIWVKREMHLDRDTAEYKEILEDINDFYDCFHML
uniref:uncharacterized protein LOC123998645 isoform X1 n=1 Tax=Oncorhynchus gorbuscha TaxID=8017 RepID=UPI001EAEB2B0|nr:uncharacterized protein LOC123998645 isoform X1 [Oncorhynchus gorbuscha]